MGISSLYHDMPSTAEPEFKGYSTGINYDTDIITRDLFPKAARYDEGR
jgi:hypothetical protein